MGAGYKMNKQEGVYYFWRMRIYRKKGGGLIEQSRNFLRFLCMFMYGVCDMYACEMCGWV